MKTRVRKKVLARRPFEGPQEDRSLNARELVFSGPLWQPTPRPVQAFGAALRLRSKLQFDAIYAGGQAASMTAFFALAA
jgi:hypothetical protein